MPLPADAPRILTSLEVAAMLRVSKSKVHRMARGGELPHYRVGGLLRFDVRDVQTYLDGTRVGGAS